MSDAKKGGDLFDMAKDGTTIPGDAGVQNLIPSVPRPDQDAVSVDNPTDIPRTTADPGATGEVATGYVYCFQEPVSKPKPPPS